MLPLLTGLSEQVRTGGEMGMARTALAAREDLDQVCCVYGVYVCVCVCTHVYM
jgi:hypothetical protein